MFSGSLRTRLALLYGGVFLVLALAMLAIPFVSVSETQHVGSSGPPVVRYPGRSLLPDLTVLLISLALAVVASLGLGWLLAGRLLRPLQAIVATARDISATNLSRRLRTGKRDDEFSRLGETLNDLFARLEASFESQRHFVANAAHELRTPLAAERTVLQVALRDPDASVASLRAACDEVLQLGEQQEKLIDALLTLAGSERGIARAEPFDLAEVAAGVIADAPHRRQARHRRPPRAIPGWRKAWWRTWSGTRSGTTCPAAGPRSRPGRSGGRAVLRVSNSGPVIPPAEVDRLFQPFQRLGDERVRRRTGTAAGTASGSPSCARSRSRTARSSPRAPGPRAASTSR